MPRRKTDQPDPLTPVFRPPGSEDTGITSQVVPKLKDTQKIGPAQAYINSLGIGAKSQAQVARELGVSIVTVRKLMTVPELNAPSYIADWGKRQIYIYTPEDVAELRAYLAKQRSPAALRRRKT